MVEAEDFSVEAAEVFCLNVLRREPIDVNWVGRAKI